LGVRRRKKKSKRKINQLIQRVRIVITRMEEKIEKTRR